MTPEEAKKFIQEANKRAEESARKWHSSAKSKPGAFRQTVAHVLKKDGK